MSFANATALAPHDVKRSAAIDLSAAMHNADTVNGNKFVNDPGRTLLRVKNVGAQVTVTVDTPATVDNLAVADLTATVPANTGDILLGPFSGFYHQPGTSEVYFTVSGACTVDPYHLAID